MRKYKYTSISCPNCKEVHQIKDSNKGSTIRCLCGKKLMVVRFNGKHELVEV